MISDKMISLLLLAVYTTTCAASVARVQVCEWGRPDGRTLACPHGKVVKILSAVYGRKSTKICARAYHRGVTNCGSAYSLTKSQQMCNGKQKCYLRASNSMYGE